MPWYLSVLHHDGGYAYYMDGSTPLIGHPIRLMEKPPP